MANPVTELRNIPADVLVVGGGGAGLRAAIGAREKGARVIMASKGALGRCGASPMAGADLTCHGQGMRAAGFFGEPRDSEEKFLNDIVYQGCFLGDQKLAYGYIAGGPARLLELLEWGMKPGSTDERAVFVKGTRIVDALVRQARKIGVTLMEDIAILELLTQNGQVCGALGVDICSGDLLVFHCKAVVIATGGWHKAYTPVTGSRELTGDGVAMAYRAGASVSNMEFVTFACNVHYWPMLWRGSIFGYCIGLICANYLENELGESIFDQYDPWMVEYANRTEWNKCFVSLVSAKEIRAGKATPHGGVYYKLGHHSFEKFSSCVNAHYPNWNFKGIDFQPMAEIMKAGGGVEVGPGAEYFEGGLSVDARYACSMPGLYAAGEAACSLFGANRVAAATMEMLTTGAIAGWSAAEDVLNQPLLDLNDDQVKRLVEKITLPLESTNGVPPAEVRNRIQVTSQAKLGPVRNEQELSDYLQFIATMRAEIPFVSAQAPGRVYNQSWLEALELENMLQVLELSAKGALERRESRGVHFREDYPFCDNDHWLQEVTQTNENGQNVIARRTIDTSLMTPPSGVLPHMEMLKKMMQGHSEIGGHH